MSAVRQITYVNGEERIGEVLVDCLAPGGKERGMREGTADVSIAAGRVAARSTALDAELGSGAC